jgi:hypothetical protein
VLVIPTPGKELPEVRSVTKILLYLRNDGCTFNNTESHGRFHISTEQDQGRSRSQASVTEVTCPG